MLHGSLSIIFSIFKQIGYHMSCAIKFGILQQLDVVYAWSTGMLSCSNAASYASNTN